MSRREDQSGRSPLRWIKWGVIAVVALVALGYGAIFVYTEFINDPADELGTDDLSERLQASDPTTAAEGTTSSAATPTTAATTTGSSATDGATTSVDGTWNATDASELGYRVKEILFGVDTEAVGRTNEITGSLTIEGTSVVDAEFVVDMTTVASDRSQRDGQFNGRIMSTDEFPTSTFVLTEPIELGSIPPPGEQITTTATGDLTLRGVTNPVTFDVTAQLEGDRIGVLGNIPIVFADYSIPNPSFGGIETEDNGELEFVLVFERA